MEQVSVAQSLVKVELCTDASRWEEFVRQTEAAQNYHLWGWKQVIEETYGHTTHYLAVRREAAIEGILPLVAIKSRLFGHFLVSLPFFNYGGVVTVNSEARAALVARAGRLAR